MRVEDMQPGACYTVELKRVGGYVTAYAGRFLGKVWTYHDEEAIAIGIVGEGRHVKIATSLITDVRDAPDLEAQAMKEAVA